MSIMPKCDVVNPTCGYPSGSTFKCATKRNKSTVIINLPQQGGLDTMYTQTSPKQLLDYVPGADCTCADAGVCELTVPEALWASTVEKKKQEIFDNATRNWKNSCHGQCGETCKNGNAKNLATCHCPKEACSFTLPKVPCHNITYQNGTKCCKQNYNLANGSNMSTVNCTYDWTEVPAPTPTFWQEAQQVLQVKEACRASSWEQAGAMSLSMFASELVAEQLVHAIKNAKCSGFLKSLTHGLNFKKILQMVKTAATMGFMMPVILCGASLELAAVESCKHFDNGTPQVRVECLAAAIAPIAATMKLAQSLVSYFGGEPAFGKKWWAKVKAKAEARKQARENNQEPAEEDENMDLDSDQTDMLEHVGEDDMTADPDASGGATIDNPESAMSGPEAIKENYLGKDAFTGYKETLVGPLAGAVCMAVMMELDKVESYKTKCQNNLACSASAFGVCQTLLTMIGNLLPPNSGPNSYNAECEDEENNKDGTDQDNKVKEGEESRVEQNSADVTDPNAVDPNAVDPVSPEESALKEAIDEHNEQYKQERDEAEQTDADAEAQAVEKAESQIKAEEEQSRLNAEEQSKANDPNDGDDPELEDEGFDFRG
jgi:hypothetical protein